jgi:hypothetical protein
VKFEERRSSQTVRQWRALLSQRCVAAPDASGKWMCPVTFLSQRCVAVPEASGRPIFGVNGIENNDSFGCRLSLCDSLLESAVLVGFRFSAAHSRQFFVLSHAPRRARKSACVRVLSVGFWCVLCFPKRSPHENEMARGTSLGSSYSHLRQSMVELGEQ